MTARLLFPLAIALASCDGFTNCTAEAVPAVEVEVRDASGAPAACDARLILRDGAFVDTVTVFEAYGFDVPPDTLDACARWPDALTLSGLWERAGTYSVRVEKPGFEAWERSGVRVRGDACHVRTARLEATLTRTAS